MSAAAAGRKTLAQLYRQGWHEIPEVMTSSVIMLIGLGFLGAGLSMYSNKSGDIRRYRLRYTVYREDDERVKTIRE